MGRGQEPSLSASLEEAKVEAVVGALICPGHNEALMTAAGVGRRVRSPLRCTGVSQRRRHLFCRGPRPPLLRRTGGCSCSRRRGSRERRHPRSFLQPPPSPTAALIPPFRGTSRWSPAKGSGLALSVPDGAAPPSLTLCLTLSLPPVGSPPLSWSPQTKTISIWEHLSVAVWCLLNRGTEDVFKTT